MNYVIRAKVIKVERKSRALRAIMNKETKEAVVEREDLGWFVRFEGSHEGLYLGHDEPTLKAGQWCTLTIEPEV
jgi:hypothetical protein